MLDKILSFIAERLGVDWIIEEGIIDGWNYIKYKNGKMEMYKIQDRMAFGKVSNFGTASIPWYRYSYTFEVDKYLVRLDSIDAYGQNSGYITQGTISGANPTLAEIFLTSPIKTTPLVFEKVPIRIVGRWK